MSIIAETIVRIRADAAGVVAQAEVEGSRAGRAFSSAFNRSSRGSFGNVEKELGGATRGAAAGSGAFSGLGRSLAFASGAFLGTASAVKVVKDSLSAAADQQKQLERTDALFKQVAAHVKEFAQGAATSLGLSDDEALKFANDLGQMLVPLGIAPAKAASMSVELTKLTANLAAMRNEDPTVVLAKIEAGLRGRGASLKAYGIDVSTATLKEEALRLGLVKQTADTAKVALARQTLAIKTADLTKANKDYASNTTQVASATQGVEKAQAALTKAVAGAVPALTQQEKSQAAVNIILQQGGRYMGEFGKHSDDLANKEKVLHAEIKNLEEGIGKALIPTVDHVVGSMADWLKSGKNQETVQRDVTSAVKTTTSVLSTAWDVIKTGVSVIRPVVDAVGGFKDALELLLAIKIGFWVTGTLLPAMQRAQAAWAGTGAAAAGAAATTTAATATMSGDMAILARSSSTLSTVRTQVASVGAAAEASGTKLATLRGGLSRLGSIGKIAVPISIITTVLDSKQSPWSAGVQGGIMGLLFGGPEAAVAAAAASIALNVVVNYVKGSGSIDNPADKVPFSRSGPAKVPIVQAQGNTRDVYYIRNVANEMWVSGESRLTIYNALVAAGYNPGVVAQAVVDATRDDGNTSARKKVLAQNRKAAAAAATQAGDAAGAALNPVPGGGSIIETPGVGTHNQSDWQSGNAIDVTVKTGSPILSPVNGVVVKVDPFVNQHGSGTKVIYGAALTINGDGNLWFITHLAKVTVAQGAQVKKGQQIGIAGNIGHVHIAVESGSPMQIPGLTAGDKGGANTLWEGQGSGTATPVPTPTTSSLVVGVKAKKAPTASLPAELRDDLSTAQRAVTTARPKGGSALERAVLAEIDTDNAVLADIAKLVASGKLTKAKADTAIRSIKADRARMQAELETLHKQAGKAYAKAEVSQGLVNQVVAGLGIPDIKDRGRAVEEVGQAYEGLTNAALKRILAVRAKAKAQLATEIKKGQTAETAATDIIASLLGIDPNTKFTETDKWGRQVTMTVGQVTVDAQKALRDLKTAIASGNKAAIAAAINEWKAAGPEISQAVQAAQAAQLTAFETSFSRLQSRIDTAFQRETSAVIASMQAALNQQIAAITAEAAKLTPAEKALKAAQDSYAEWQRRISFGGTQQSASDAKSRLASLLGVGVGGVLDGQVVTQADIQAASDQLVAAQNQIQDDLYQKQIAGLQKSADASRKAADAALQAQITALQAAEAVREQDYQDQRDAQQTALDDQLADWQKHLEDGSAKWSDFTAWLQGLGASGNFGPNPVVAMTDAGQAQGSAFATAYIAELAAAYAAQQALLNGQDPTTAVKNNYGSTGGTGHGIGNLGFALGGEIPGTFRGGDDRFALVSPGETIIDRRLTNALKQAFLGGGGAGAAGGDRMLEVLVALLKEAKEHTDLLGQPVHIPVPVPESPNRAAFKAMR